MIDKDKFWEENHRNCPWHERGTDDDERDGNCFGQPTYNQHVNDVRYSLCNQHTCPIFHWVEALAEEQNDGQTDS